MLKVRFSFDIVFREYEINFAYVNLYRFIVVSQ